MIWASIWVHSSWRTSFTLREQLELTRSVTFDALLCGVVLCQCLRWLPDFRTDMLLIRMAVVSTVTSGNHKTRLTSAIRSNSCYRYHMLVSSRNWHHGDSHKQYMGDLHARFRHQLRSIRAFRRLEMFILFVFILP